MSQSDDVSEMLSNLEAIKSGDDPRSPNENDRPDSEAASTTAPSSHSVTQNELENPTDSLAFARAEVDRLYSDFDEIAQTLPRNDLWVGVARWTGRNGYCRYNSKLESHRFNKRVTGYTKKSGHHCIVINERIFEKGNYDGFLDTVRHELAHAVCYEANGESQGHNHKWKAMATKLGANPSSTNHKRDRSDEYKYYIYCPECGMTGGKTKRSKVIKQPFNRKCGKCGNSPLSSYEAGQKPPEENGVVKVESLRWDNQDEWVQAGRP